MPFWFSSSGHGSPSWNSRSLLCPTSPSDMRRHSAQHRGELSEACTFPRPSPAWPIPSLATPAPNKGPSLPTASLNYARAPSAVTGTLLSPGVPGRSISLLFLLPNCPAQSRCSVNKSEFLFPYKLNCNLMPQAQQPCAALHGLSPPP